MSCCGFILRLKTSQSVGHRMAEHFRDVRRGGGGKTYHLHIGMHGTMAPLHWSDQPTNLPTATVLHWLGRCSRQTSEDVDVDKG